jgi:predicted permease
MTLDRFFFLLLHPYHLLTLVLLALVYCGYTVPALYDLRIFFLALLLGLLVARIAYVKITGRTSSGAKEAQP